MSVEVKMIAKSFIAMIIIYLILIVIMFGTSWLLEKKVFTEYTLENIKQVLPNELSNAEVIAVEYIPRTKYIYLITNTKQFYAIDFDVSKVIYHTSLDFLNHPIDMKSTESLLSILDEKEGKKEIVIVDIDIWGNLAPRAYPPFKIDNNLDNIVIQGSLHSYIFSDTLNHLKTYTLKHADIPFEFLDQLPKNLQKKIGGFQDVEPYWSQDYLTKISQIINEYNAKKIEFLGDYNLDMICINSKRVVYNHIYNIDDVAGKYSYHTIQNGMKIKDIALKINDSYIAEKVVFISGNNHKLYCADVAPSNTYIVVSFLHKISYFISTLPLLAILDRQ